MISILKRQIRHVSGASKKATSVEVLEKRWHRLCSSGASIEEMEKLIEDLKKKHDTPERLEERRAFRKRQLWFVER